MRFRRVNVFGVGHVKIAVIVLGREHAVLSGTTVVPGCSDFTRMYLLVCGRRERSDRFPLFAAETNPLQSDAQHHFYRPARRPVGQRLRL